MQRRARRAEVDSCDMFSSNVKGAAELRCHRLKRRRLHLVRRRQRMSAAVRLLWQLRREQEAALRHCGGLAVA